MRAECGGEVSSCKLEMSLANDRGRNGRWHIPRVDTSGQQKGLQWESKDVCWDLATESLECLPGDSEDIRIQEYRSPCFTLHFTDKETETQKTCPRPCG